MGPYPRGRARTRLQQELEQTRPTGGQSHGRGGEGPDHIQSRCTVGCGQEVKALPLSLSISQEVDMAIRVEPFSESELRQMQRDTVIIPGGGATLGDGYACTTTALLIARFLATIDARRDDMSEITLVRCDTCHYWAERGADTFTQEPYGECRRLCWTAHEWHGSHWCGEWEPVDSNVTHEAES